MVAYKMPIISIIELPIAISRAVLRGLFNLSFQRQRIVKIKNALASTNKANGNPCKPPNIIVPRRKPIMQNGMRADSPMSKTTFDPFFILFFN